MRGGGFFSGGNSRDMNNATPTDGATAVKEAVAWLSAIPADFDAALQFERQGRVEASASPLRYSPLSERETQMLVTIYRAFLSGGKTAMDAQVESLLKFGVLEFSTSSSPAAIQAAKVEQ